MLARPAHRIRRPYELARAPPANQDVGVQGEEYSGEEDMRMVSLKTTPVLPKLTGFASHHQLRDLFTLSSVDPKYAYLVAKADGTANLRCVNLETGEYRTVGAICNKTRGPIHCVTTGFGYLAFVSFNVMYLINESNWRQVWMRQDHMNGMFNSCVLTKLERNGTEEVVLLVGSNGGAIYVVEVPELPNHEESTSVVAVPPSDSESAQSEAKSEASSEQVPLIVDVDTTIELTVSDTESSDAESATPPFPILRMKQCLTRAIINKPRSRIQNVNCLAQGRGIYCDYLVGAPDNESRLYVFLHQYDQDASTLSIDEDSTESREQLFGPEVCFELIEQQQASSSLVLPLVTVNEMEKSKKRAESEEDEEEEWTPSRHSVPERNSLNVAWSPWNKKSLIAAGTDSCELIIYNFDSVHGMLSENDPTHVFDVKESAACEVYRAKFAQDVRLLKFSPLASVPLLMVGDMSSTLAFVDCDTWKLERISLPPGSLITGAFWALDARAVFVATTLGIVKVHVKRIPCLMDTLLSAIVLKPTLTTMEEVRAELSEEMNEPFDLLSFGRLAARTIHWPDESSLVPPLPPPEPAHTIDADLPALQSIGAGPFMVRRTFVR